MADFAGLYARSGGEKFGLTFAEFAEILREVSSRYAIPYDSLRLEELVLARACARGSEAAWDCFLKQYRRKLYDMATAIARDETAGRELADSLYAELYASKLASYTGRGSLEGWLRAVLAQEYVNQIRRGRRLESLDEKIEAGEPAKDPVDARLEEAVDVALSELSAEDRLLLTSWYLDGRTLAEIAHMIGVHESTVSRRMEKITGALRKRIIKGLRERGMDARAAEDAMKADVRDLSLDVRGRLAQEKGGGTFL